MDTNTHRSATAEQLQQWADLASNATEGPWRHEADDSPFDVPITTGELDYLCTSPDDGVRGGHSIEDAAFIVASRTAVPKMAAALQAVLDLHGRLPFFSEPGSDECPHDDDYEGDRHYLSNYDDLMICGDAEVESTCSECFSEESLCEPVDWPCPTVIAINEVFEATV